MSVPLTNVPRVSVPHVPKPQFRHNLNHDHLQFYPQQQKNHKNQQQHHHQQQQQVQHKQQPLVTEFPQIDFDKCPAINDVKTAPNVECPLCFKFIARTKEAIEEHRMVLCKYYDNNNNNNNNNNNKENIFDEFDRSIHSKIDEKIEDEKINGQCMYCVTVVFCFFFLFGEKKWFDFSQLFCFCFIFVVFFFFLYLFVYLF